MPDLLHATVTRRTALSGRYLDAASHQSMDAYLRDWEQAHARLGSAIEALRRHRDERMEATADGLWPPPPSTHCEDICIPGGCVGACSGPEEAS